MDTPYENLANAIILQAVKDYRLALKRYSRHPEKDAFTQNKEELERFFRSEWFGVLTNLDPELLICRLGREAV